MIFIPRRRFHLISFLCFLAFVSCLSIGLFNYFDIEKGNVTDELYGWDSVNQSCLFRVGAWTENVCRETLDNLPKFPKYPRFPDQRHCVQNISSIVKNGARNAAIKRILVSFSSLERGFYQFRVKSSLPLRIYLGNRHQSSGGDLVLVSSGSTFSRTIFSKSCFLNKNSVLEIITYCPPGDNLLEIDWLMPGSARFVSILSRDLEPAHHVVPTQNSPRQILPPDRRTLVGFITQSHFKNGFRICSLHDVQVWRKDINTRNITVLSASSPLDTFIHEVLKLILACLQKAAPSKYPDFKINMLELTQNSTRNKSPRRLLVDLNFTVDGLDYVERFNEYLYAYRRGNQLELCRPLCYQWDRAITLSFVFLTDCSRNDSPWGLHFIENTIELLQRSLEVNFRVVLTACDERQRRSYESRLQDSDIDRKTIVLLQEEVHKKSRAMKAVLSLEEMDNSIVVFCESRVKMPAGIAEEIRKHTFKALMAYSPAPFRLDCGYFPEAAPVEGDRCPMCGGVTAMYKKDWEQVILSFDENEDVLKDKAKLLDRIEKTGIETIHVKLKGFFRI